jgi:hypothetical protein
MVCPERDGAKPIVSSPLPATHPSTAASVLAASIASLSEHVPLVVCSSSVVVTVMVSAQAGLER